MEISEETVVTLGIRMTRAEERELWNTPRTKRRVCGMRVVHWLTDDGNNEMLLEGETVYRHIWLTDGVAPGR